MEKLDYPELVQQILKTRTENRSPNDTETHLIFERFGLIFPILLLTEKLLLQLKILRFGHFYSFIIKC